MSQDVIDILTFGITFLITYPIASYCWFLLARWILRKFDSDLLG